MFDKFFLSLTLRGDPGTEAFISISQIAAVIEASGAQGTEIILDCGEKIIVGESIKYVHDELVDKMEALNGKT